VLPRISIGRYQTAVVNPKHNPRVKKKTSLSRIKFVILNPRLYSAVPAGRLALGTQLEDLALGACPLWAQNREK
jgi:hypothetical protein